MFEVGWSFLFLVKNACFKSFGNYSNKQNGVEEKDSYSEHPLLVYKELLFLVYRVAFVWPIYAE